MSPTRARLRFVENLVAGTRRDLVRLNGLPADYRFALVTTARAFQIFARYARVAADENRSEEPDDKFEKQAADGYGSDFKKVAGWLTYGQFKWAANETRMEVAKLLLPDLTIVRNDSIPTTVLNNG